MSDPTSGRPDESVADEPVVAEPVVADAIVVAAGSSSRMGGIDKLEAVVDGVPILGHALRAIAAAPEVRRIVVVATSERIEAIGGASWLPPKVDLLVTGASRRQDSVREGFSQMMANLQGRSEPEVVLVHDGARPLVPTDLVSAVAGAARRHGAAIPVVPVGDTIKRLAPDGTVVGAGERDGLGAAQTPQGIRTEWLRAAFERFPADGPETFTDEAALLEACKLPVHAIPGDDRNLKVTRPADLARVATLLGDAPSTAPPRGATATASATATGGSTGRTVASGPSDRIAAAATVAAAADQAGVRVGLGSDSHPFGPGDGLALGSLVIDGAPRLYGHSDGDVLLHAIADALLGAAGLGDLGRIFPADPRTPAGIASGELLAEVVHGVHSAGFTIGTVDCTVVAGRPRLAARLPEIGARIADLLSIDASAVNVKASSGNLDGMEGAGRGISATAVVVLGRGAGR